MSTQQSLTQLQAILEKHRANELSYKDKLKELNLTRSKIGDQVQVLQQTYDKKLKGLEQKLQVLKNHNEQLLRDNVLYKSEIDTYQSRLVEKEKIIAMLLSQRKDLPVIGNSERSKSQKTDSLNANEEQSKSFKKPAAFKQDIEQVPPTTLKFKQEIIQQKINTQKLENKQEMQLQHSAQPALPEVKRLIPPPKKKGAPIPSVSTPKPVQPQTQKSQQSIKQEEDSHLISNKPPKPSNRVKTRKNQPVNYPSPKFNSRQEVQQQQPAFQANNFFSNLGKQNKVQQDKVNDTQHSHVPFEQEQIPAVLNQYTQQQKQEQNYQNNQQQNEQAHEQPAPQYYPQEENQQEEVQPIHYNQDYQNTNAQEYHQNEVEKPQIHQQNNFLSHFNNNYSQNPYYEPQQQVPKKAKKITKRERIQSLDSEVSGNDFFSQLGRSQNEQHHNLQIEQSSIDHIDRDNSLMSNEQPYFAEEAQVVAKKPVKMPKKKGKRDQIKMMDPSCFE